MNPNKQHEANNFESARSLLSSREKQPDHQSRGEDCNAKNIERRRNEAEDTARPKTRTTSKKKSPQATAWIPQQTCYENETQTEERERPARSVIYDTTGKHPRAPPQAGLGRRNSIFPKKYVWASCLVRTPFFLQRHPSERTRYTVILGSTTPFTLLAKASGHDHALLPFSHTTRDMLS